MNNLRFEIPSAPRYISEASSKVLNLFKGLKLDKEVFFDIRLCLEEAVINAMKYGNNFNKDLPVSINCSLSCDRFEMTVRDRGKGFDHTNLPDPRSNKNILKHGGRGLFLICNLMDEVKFNDSGNEIKMVKFLSGGKTHGCKGEEGL